MVPVGRSIVAAPPPAQARHGFEDAPGESIVPVLALAQACHEFGDAPGESMLPVLALAQACHEFGDAPGESMLPVPTLAQARHEFGDAPGESMLPVPTLAQARHEFGGARGGSILPVKRVPAGNDRLAEHVPELRERLSSFPDALWTRRGGAEPRRDATGSNCRSILRTSGSGRRHPGAARWKRSPAAGSFRTDDAEARGAAVVSDLGIGVAPG
jgi:hypothetical protein